MKKVISALLCLLIISSFVSTTFAAEQRSFIHPGILHTTLDLSTIAGEIEKGNEFYLNSLNALTVSKYAQPTVTARATETIVRGGNGQNFAQLYEDCAKAYQNALRYHIEGNEECGKAACSILNAWSEKLKNVTGNADRYLAAGLYGYQMANAAELMRDYPGFETKRMQDMLINVFYKPLCERFLVSNEFGRDHNDACITNYWANWDLANMAATVAIGIFCVDVQNVLIGIAYIRIFGNQIIFGAGSGGTDVRNHHFVQFDDQLGIHTVCRNVIQHIAGGILTPGFHRQERFRSVDHQLTIFQIGLDLDVVITPVFVGDVN
jgi:hypothetical protein